MCELTTNISINMVENKGVDMLQLSIDLERLVFSLEAFNGVIWDTSNFESIIILQIDDEGVLDEFRNFFNRRNVNFVEW